MSDIKGVVPPATTPFDAAGELVLSDAGRQVEWLIANGAHAVAVGGSTGEGHTLAAEEFRDLVETAIASAAGRVPVVAGIITDSTRDAVRRGLAVRDLGAHGAIAAILSAAPRPSGELWEAVQAGDHPRALALHLALLRLWNALMPHDNLPASTKYAQQVQGCPSGLARQPMPMPGPEHQARIRAALEGLGLGG